MEVDKDIKFSFLSLVGFRSQQVFLEFKRGNIAAIFQRTIEF